MQLLFGKKGSVLKVSPGGASGEQVSFSSIQCMKSQN